MERERCRQSRLRVLFTSRRFVGVGGVNRPWRWRGSGADGTGDRGVVVAERWAQILMQSTRRLQRYGCRRLGGGVFILRAVGKTLKPHPEWVDCLSVFGFGARGLSHLPNRTVRPSVRSVDRVVGKQARKNCLFTRRLRRYCLQYSASNPLRTEFHFSALRHGDYMLWAELWFVVCVAALIEGAKTIQKTTLT
jgi:hypothetical protein